VPDATSGFRALTREAALHTLGAQLLPYTLETSIQAGAQRRAIRSVPVRTNLANPPLPADEQPAPLSGQFDGDIRAGLYLLSPAASVRHDSAWLALLAGTAIGVRSSGGFLQAKGGAGHIQILDSSCAPRRRLQARRRC
jgi:hypothetical protein